MKRLVLAALFLTGGCAMSLPEGISFARPLDRQPVAGTIIDTVPSGATLIYPDGECLTPCRIDYGERIQVTLGKAGYRPKTLIVPVGATDVVLDLEPVGRSTPVEEDMLPQL